MRKEEAMDFLDNTKIYVHGKGKKIQSKLFEIGFTWCDGTTVYDHTEAPFLYITDKKMTYGLYLVAFREKEAREVSVDDILNIKIDRFMKQEQKVWIQGDPKRGNEVIAKLESLGGKNISEYTGARKDLIYYIRPRGYIDYVREGSVMCELVKDNYKEYILPPKYFKPFDKVLVKGYRDSVWWPYLYGFETVYKFYFVGGSELGKENCQVIPFNKDTEHLIGTKDEYNE